MSTLQDWAPSPPGYVHETQVPLVTACCITSTTLAFIFVGMRLYVRRYILGGVGVDDWLALMGAVCMTGITALTLWGTTIGYGTHIWEVKESSMQDLRTVIIAVPFVAQIGNMFVQLTLLTFYCRLAPYRVLHYICYFVMFLTAFMSIFRVTFSSILCFHIHPNDGLICNDNMTLIVVHAVVGITTNFVAFMTPIPLLWMLKNVSVLKRLGLIVIFSVGLIAVAACLVKIFVFKEAIKAGDPSWGMARVAIICQVEVGAGLTCACLPMVRPLYLHTSWFSSTPRETPPVDVIPKVERRGGSGNGTALLRRARAGWEGKSLTATWNGVQRYYHTRCGRKRSIIEVADLEGLGVLGSRLDFPSHPGRSEKVGHNVPDSCGSQLAGDIASECRGNKTPGESTPLSSLTPVPSCHKARVTRDELRCLSRFQPSATSHKGEIADLALSPRRPKTNESGNAVLLSSVAPMANGGIGEGEGISTAARTESSTATIKDTAPLGVVRGVNLGT
ncbi:hypothetical protein L211DRAFT_847044 [Terfezia boudieri ATCC MYA-4762]|uniref:Rhodopsin domain-containing protein n=1 Tax=Terfezia boudieri ATCC MYA-4762 TaxID=1051890 RepID=A0A3N4M1S8_9PEZI|nr:hypothetical protein L211DRAFT_847044 [Terfezia boudieri ATCC MYA-4762]